MTESFQWSENESKEANVRKNASMSNYKNRLETKEKMESLSRETDKMEYQTEILEMEEYNNQTKILRKWAHQQDGEDKKKISELEDRTLEIARSE